jgi:hypothetical protein
MEVVLKYQKNQGNNKEETIYNRYMDAFNAVKVGLKTIRKYSKSGTAYKGYRFEILNDK